ncbi:MAG: flagellar assembly protein FliW [Verrucomicrobiales bacterium]|nr:flagellar assembly protein FliW [Verrucomicrobiales bacterium]
MMTTAPSKPEVLALNGEESAIESTIELPLGLLGFESIKTYVLIAHPEEAPFQWLQMSASPGHSFLVVPPAAVLPNYSPELSEADVDFLGLDDPHDACVLNIVTLRPGGRSTVNLKGPIVLNRRTGVAKQVIPINAMRFPLQHPLPAVS